MHNMCTTVFREYEDHICNSAVTLPIVRVIVRVIVTVIVTVTDDYWIVSV